MTKITTRNVIRMWWSTNPYLVGYAETKQRAEEALERLMESTPFRGTVRQVVAEIAQVKRNIGSAFCHFELRTADGRAVSRDDLDDCINNAAYYSRDCRR